MLHIDSQSLPAAEVEESLERRNSADRVPFHWVSRIPAVLGSERGGVGMRPAPGEGYSGTPLKGRSFCISV